MKGTGEGLTGAVAGPQLLHGAQHVLGDLVSVEHGVVAVLRVVSGAGVVQIGPQAMDGEPLGPVQLSLTSKICGIVAYLKTVKIDPLTAQK